MHITVKSWIRIRIRIKIESFRGSKKSCEGPLTLTMEAWRVFRLPQHPDPDTH